MFHNFSHFVNSQIVFNCNIVSWRIQWTIYLTKNQKSKHFCYIKVYIIWKFSKLPIERRKTYQPKNFPELKNLLQNSHILILCKLQHIRFLCLICDSLMRWITRFVFLKVCVGFSIFNCFVFIKVNVYVQQKACSFWLMIPFKTKTLFCQSYDICMSCRSPKIDLGMNCLMLGNWSFEIVGIFNI